MSEIEKALMLIIAFLIGGMIMMYFIIMDISDKRLEESEMCRVVAEECSNLLKCK